MRVVGGRLKGRNLASPSGREIRPTADRLRESVFNILVHAYDNPIEDARVLDLFAGSGALGLEALSRGAASCIFVEQDKAALDALRTNITKLGGAKEIGADVRAQSVLALGHAVAPLDLIVMDPPYASGAGAVALDKLARLGWIGDATWISIETAKPELVEVAGFVEDVSRVHGKARITLLRRV